MTRETNAGSGWMTGVLAALLSVLAAGCGTIRGVPPEFMANPGEVTTVRAPRPEDGLPVSHLRKHLVFAPRPDTLQNVDVTPTDANTIFYPRLRLMTEEEIVNTRPVVKGDVTGATNVLEKASDSFVAILDLKNESAQAAASGRLAADFLYRCVKREGSKKNWDINIADRENAYRLMMGEKEELKKDDLAVSDSEMFKTAKSLNYATFWMTGAVTIYSLENKELQFDWTLESKSYDQFRQAIDDWKAAYKAYQNDYEKIYMPAYKRYLDEFQARCDQQDRYYNEYLERYGRYKDEYAAYSLAYNEYVDHIRRIALIGNIIFSPLHIAFEIISFGDADTWAKAVPYVKRYQIPKESKPSLGFPDRPVPLLDLSNDIPPRYDQEAVMTVLASQGKIPPPVSRVATVCNVGVTLRLVAGKTSDIIWIGNGTSRSTDLQLGMERVCDGLVGKLMDDVRLKPGK